MCYNLMLLSSLLHLLVALSTAANAACEMWSCNLIEEMPLVQFISYKLT